MSRSRIFVIAVAVLGGAGIVIGALAVTRGGGGASPPAPARAAVSYSSAASCPSRS